MKLSVVIPSRNGSKILERYLPDIILETGECHGEVIVVDDCSEDGTGEFLTAGFPGVRVLRMDEPSGFSISVNAGMAASRGEYLLLLNNDTAPEPGSFQLLADTLDRADPAVGAAVPSIPRPDGTDDSLMRWRVHRGLAVTGQTDEGNPYPSGACSMWRRGAWNALNGLDPVYSPIYWEDTDLGARMVKKGYSMIRVPEAVVWHMHAATMGSTPETLTLRERNRFVFMARHNIKPVFWLPLHLFSALLRGNRPFIQGYLDYRRMEHNR